MFLLSVTDLDDQLNAIKINLSFFVVPGNEHCWALQCQHQNDHQHPGWRWPVPTVRALRAPFPGWNQSHLHQSFVHSKRHRGGRGQMLKSPRPLNHTTHRHAWSLWIGNHGLGPTIVCLLQDIVLDFWPGPIHAVDGDRGLSSPLSYAIISGTVHTDTFQY